MLVHADAWAPMDAVANPHDIRRLEANAHCECLESSILEVMDAIFGMSIVSSAFVSMHKPHVYNGQGTPAISLSLTREQWQKTKR